MEDSFFFFLNDIRIVINRDEVNVEESLLDFVRRSFLKGTKQCCGEGGCGSCSAVLSDIDPKTKKIRHRLINTCLIPVPFVYGKKVTTIEGVGTSKTEIHPIQERLAKMYGTQCGYCSPGFVMSVYAQINQKEESSVGDIENCISGNLCRCTGYRPIVESLRSLGVNYDESMGSLMCKEGNKVCSKRIVNKSIDVPEDVFKFSCVSRQFSFHGKKKWFSPATFEELLELKSIHKDSKTSIIAGNTDIGFERRYHPEQDFRVYISTSSNYIPEICDVTFSEDVLTIGSAVTIQEIDHYLKERIRLLKLNNESYKARNFEAIQKQVSTFGSNAIRSVGTIGGSVVANDPLSDLLPILVCIGSSVTVCSTEGKRVLPLGKFIIAENKVDLKPNEVLMNVIIPESKKNQFSNSFKVSRRKFDDQCLINAAFSVSLDHEDVVQNVSLVYGGISQTPRTRAEETEMILLGKKWSMETFEVALKKLREEVPQLTTMRRGSIPYKQTLVLSLFSRFYFDDVLNRNSPAPKVKKYDEEATELKYNQRLPPPIPQSEQLPSHLESLHHATGEAQYTADLPFPKNGLYGSPILSKNPHADFEFGESLDDIVKEHEEVKAIMTSKDIKGSNNIGSIRPDEEVFASETSNYYGQVLGLVLATSQEKAREISQKIKIVYHQKEFVGTLAEAIEKEEFVELHHPLLLERGNIKESLEREDCVIVEGEFFIGGQEHMYIEPTASVAYPRGPKSIEVITTVQNPTLVQKSVAKVLGWAQHNIISRVDRVGGAFGGKQDRPMFVAAMACIAAENLGVPVMVELSRDQDFQISGQRHEFCGKYKLSCEKETAKIAGLDIQMFNNGGFSMDLSPEVMKVGIFSIDGGYHIPTYRIEGKTCRTNRVSCTAFRGFGKPQAQAWTEHIIMKACQKAFPNMDPAQFREINLLREGMKILENEVADNNLFETWKKGISIYEKEKKKVEEFNKKSVWWKKRGIGISPIKANAGFDLDFMNQASALVHVYQDGTVMACHSGVEMGQGINTKMAQIVSNELNIPLGQVVISGTSTEKNPNTSATAAVSGTDLNGNAIIDACNKILERLDQMEGETFKKKVENAYVNRVNLSANGFYAWPRFGYDFEKKTGSYTFYFTWATSVSVVEVDLLTGAFELLKNDIVADCGKPINHAVDIGQMEGGFAQGLGLYTLEELIWAKSDAHLRTRNVSTYKIPTVEDMPKEWNIEFIDKKSRSGVYSSKACGELGVSCAISVVVAINDVIRKYAKGNPEVVSNFPVTVEKIRLAMNDKFVMK